MQKTKIKHVPLQKEIILANNNHLFSKVHINEFCNKAANLGRKQ